MGPYPWLLNTVSQLQKNEAGPLDLGINERHTAMPSTRRPPRSLGPAGTKMAATNLIQKNKLSDSLSPVPKEFASRIRRPRPYRPVGLTVLFDPLPVAMSRIVSSQRRSRCLILAGKWAGLTMLTMLTIFLQASLIRRPRGTAAGAADPSRASSLTFSRPHAELPAEVHPVVIGVLRFRAAPRPGSIRASPPVAAASSPDAPSGRVRLG